MNDDIERLARECGANESTIFKAYPPNSVRFEFMPEQLERFYRAACRAGMESKNEWQPIETAPNDGSYILAFEWVSGSDCWPQRAGQSPRIFISRWKSDFLRWDDEIRKASYWMPLPAPPAIRAEAEKDG